MSNYTDKGYYSVVIAICAISLAILNSTFRWGLSLFEGIIISVIAGIFASWIINRFSNYFRFKLKRKRRKR